MAIKYVDFLTGNDSYTGSTISTPWKSILKATTGTINNGDEIRVRATDPLLIDLGGTIAWVKGASTFNTSIDMRGVLSVNDYICKQDDNIPFRVSAVSATQVSISLNLSYYGNTSTVQGYKYNRNATNLSQTLNASVVGNGWCKITGGWDAEYSTSTGYTTTYDSGQTIAFLILNNKSCYTYENMVFLGGSVPFYNTSVPIFSYIFNNIIVSYPTNGVFSAVQNSNVEGNNSRAGIFDVYNMKCGGRTLLLQNNVQCRTMSAITIMDGTVNISGSYLQNINNIYDLNYHTASNTNQTNCDIIKYTNNLNYYSYNVGMPAFSSYSKVFNSNFTKDANVIGGYFSNCSGITFTKQKMTDNLTILNHKHNLNNSSIVILPSIIDPKVSIKIINTNGNNENFYKTLYGNTQLSGTNNSQIVFTPSGNSTAELPLYYKIGSYLAKTGNTYTFSLKRNDVGTGGTIKVIAEQYGSQVSTFTIAGSGITSSYQDFTGVLTPTTLGQMDLVFEVCCGTGSIFVLDKITVT
jgi:hypothetical protein